MPGRTSFLILLIPLVLVAAAGSLPAQAASSPAYFLVSSTFGPSGEAVSPNFKLTGTTEGGAPAAPATSSGYRLDGGFPAVLDTGISGRPWVTGISPRYTPFLGGTSHTVHGTEFQLGAMATVTAGGVPCSVGARSNDRIAITMAPQTKPGWRSVEVVNGGGASELPRAIGVLPLLETPFPATPGRPFSITYRGRQGDLFYLGVASAKLPVAVPIGVYLYGLELNPGGLLGLIGPLPVLAASGELTLDFPAVPYPQPIFVQALAISPVPGYQPGCFSNLLQL